MKYSQYVKETVAYGIVGLVAVGLTVFFGYQQQWFLTLVSALIIWVAFDNFFCGSRLCKTGRRIKSHYIIPPFLKK